MPDYKLSLSPELDSRLRKIARDNDLDINQLLLNAVSVYSELKDRTNKDGNDVGILDKDNNPIARITLP